MSKKHRGTCVLCGTYGPLSEEDPLPRWVSRELKRLHPYDFVFATEIQTDETRVLHEHTKKVGSTSSIKLPVVCAKCNSGPLMSGIESAVGGFMTPALGGTAVELTPTRQRLLGTWGALKALMYDLRRPNDSPVVVAGDLHLYRAEGRPPPGFQMWLGRYERHEDFLAFSAREATVSDGDYEDFPAGTPHAQLLTLVFGDLVVQSAFIGIEGRRVTSDFERKNAEPFSVRVWPPSDHALQWPPPSMDSGAVQSFSGMPLGPTSIVTQRFIDDQKVSSNVGRGNVSRLLGTRTNNFSDRWRLGRRTPTAKGEV